MSDAAELGLSREELGARVLLLWGVLGDFDYALAAIRGEPDKSVVTYLKSRLPLGEGRTNGMTKRDAVSLLWQARSLRKGKADRGDSSVEAMIERAEDQLRSHIEAQSDQHQRVNRGAVSACADDPSRLGEAGG